MFSISECLCKQTMAYVKRDVLALDEPIASLLSDCPAKSRERTLSHWIALE
jgi:hypothetical protein